MPAEIVASSLPDTAEQWLAGEARARRVRWASRVSTVWACRVALVASALVLWQIAANRRWIDPFFISSPADVGAFLAEVIAERSFWADVLLTLQETLLGFAAAGVVGILAAFLLAQSRLLEDVLDPILSFLNSLPRVAFAPLFVAFFGLGMLSKVILAFSLCFFIVLNGTLTGLANVDPDMDLLTRQLGASRTQRFVKLLVPNALPNIFAALRLSLIYGFLAVVVGEMIGANSGLGQQIALYSGLLRTDAVFGLLLVLGVIATLSVEILRLIERRLLRWQ